MTSQKNAITLQGSAEIVAEFFDYGVNSILYQRGLYPPEMFQQESHYGLTMLVSTNEQLKEYLKNFVIQLKHWLTSSVVQRLVIVVSDVDTSEVLERWQFDIQCDKEALSDGKPRSKELHVIQNEIKRVIRQITATVTFLPLLDKQCSFDLLVYVDTEAPVPEVWRESGPRMIANSEEVKIASFSTSIHSVAPTVSYRKD